MPDYDGGKIKVKLVIDAAEAFQTLDSVAAKAGQGMRMNLGGGGGASIPTGARQSAHANAAMNVPVTGGGNSAAISADRILATSPINATISAHANSALVSAEDAARSAARRHRAGGGETFYAAAPHSRGYEAEVARFMPFSARAEAIGNAAAASVIASTQGQIAAARVAARADRSFESASFAAFRQQERNEARFQANMERAEFAAFREQEKATERAAREQARLAERAARAPSAFRRVMDTQVLSSGNYMSLLFGGWEVAKAYNATVRAEREANRVLSTPETQLAAYQNAIQSIEGGLFGSIVSGLGRLGGNLGLGHPIWNPVPHAYKSYDDAVAGMQDAKDMADRRQGILDTYGFGRFGAGAKREMGFRHQQAAIGLTSFALERAKITADAEARRFDIEAKIETARAMGTRPELKSASAAAVKALEAEGKTSDLTAGLQLADVARREDITIRSNFASASIAGMTGSGRNFSASLASLRQGMEAEYDAAVGNPDLQHSISVRGTAQIAAFVRGTTRESMIERLERGGVLRAQANDMAGGRSMDSLRMRLQGSVGAAILRLDPSAPGYREAVADLQRAGGNELAFAGRKYETTLAEMEASSQGLMFAAEGRPMMGSIVETLQRGRAAFDAATDPRMREAIRRNTQFQLAALKRAAEEGMQRSSAVAIAVQRTDLSGAAGRFGENLAAAADAANKSRDLAGGWKWRPIEGGPIEPGEDFAAAAKAIGGGAGEFGDAVKMFMEAVRQFKVKAS